MAKLKLYQNEAWLKMMRYEKKLSPEEIAKVAGCHENSVRSYMKKYGIR